MLLYNFSKHVLTGLFLSVLICVASAFAGTDELASLQVQAEAAIQKLSVDQQHDDMRILPRMLQASAEMHAGHFSLARELFESCIFDLNLLESQRAFSSPEFWPKQAWLEIVFDLLQGYVLIVLLAFLSARTAVSKKQIPSGRLVPEAGAWLALAGFLFGTYDFLKLGVSSSGVFDLQVVFSACAGLAGGFWPGFLCAAFFAVLRMLGYSTDWMMPAVLLICGFAGIFFFYAHSKMKPVFQVFCCGIITGAAHGVAAYWGPAWPRDYAFSAAFWTAVAEAGGVFLFFMAARSVMTLEKRKAAERELLQTQLLLLQTQIKPHFLFNALNTIAAISSKERAGQTRGLIEKLADFFRLSLQHGKDEITLQEEMEFVNTYLDLEKARFGENLSVHTYFEWTEKAKKLHIPALLIQPLVENAIRHGARRKAGQGIVRLDIYENQNSVVVKIGDNGPGFTPDKLAAWKRGEVVRGEGLGVGLRNIQERLNRFFGKKAVMHFDSSDQGTIVTLELPKGNDAAD